MSLRGVLPFPGTSGLPVGNQWPTSGRILRLERLYGHSDASPREPLVPLVGFCAALGFWWQAFSAPGLTSGAIDKHARDLIPSIPLLDSTGHHKY